MQLPSLLLSCLLLLFHSLLFHSSTSKDPPVKWAWHTAADCLRWPPALAWPPAAKLAQSWGGFRRQQWAQHTACSCWARRGCKGGLGCV